MNYDPPVILEASRNARDLGGIRTADGKQLVHARLIRSGELSRLTGRDEACLRSIGLHTVVDFRSESERLRKPDRPVAGVRYVNCPVIGSLVPGITRESVEDPYTAFSRSSYGSYIAGRGKEVMCSLYPILVESEDAVKYYRLFLDCLLENEHGALLWHCAMGKDRAGVAAALILYLLNVPMETIIADYMYTSIRCRGEIREMTDRYREFTSDEEVLDSIFWLNTTDESYIRAAFESMARQCGSVQDYFENRLHVTTAETARLRELYLE